MAVTRRSLRQLKQGLRLAFNFVGFCEAGPQSMQCFQACDESEFAMSSWVLCGKSIVNNSDKNLVDGQESSTFNVPEESLSLESRVAIDST